MFFLINTKSPEKKLQDCRQYDNKKDWSTRRTNQELLKHFEEDEKIQKIIIEQAKKQAKMNIEAIRESVLVKNMPVIATSSTCAFTIRDEYPHLLSVDNADVREQVELATRYVYRLMARQGVKLKFKQNQKIRVAYHTPCHMEKLGWAYYSIELLKLIPNVELTVLDSQCCGIAGTYGFKKENYKTSQDIGESLFRQIEACDIVGKLLLIRRMLRIGTAEKSVCQPVHIVAPGKTKRFDTEKLAPVTVQEYLRTGVAAPKPSPEEVRAMMLRHARMQVEYKGDYTGIREMRKHISWYTAGMPHSARLRARINSVESLEELEEILTSGCC